MTTAPLPLGGAALKLWSVFLLTLASLAVTVLSQAKTTDPNERAALVAFRSALIDRDNVLKNWTIGDPCNDNWAGVYCDPSLQSGQYLHVTELRLFTLNLAGALVPELGNFSALRTLDVMNNFLSGSIPSSLGNLANLEILALNGNQFTESIPEELGQLTNMNRIQLDENQLSGPVPHTFGNLTSLAHLHLNNNSFSGSIPPELGNLKNLIHILLDNNQMSGLLPPEISNASSLVIIQLDNNQLSGKIPSDYVTKLNNLTKLSFRNCSLSGTIPDLSNLDQLNVLDLSYNNFGGEIPQIVVTNITTIDLSHNQLVGQIPSFLVESGTLQELSLGNNLLNGSIPDFTQVDYTINMQLFDFQNNSFQFISLGLLGAEEAFYPNLTLWLAGNEAICSQEDYIVELKVPCQPQLGNDFLSSGNINDLPTGGPIVVTYRLKSPGFSFFTYRYEVEFQKYIANGLQIEASQVSVQSYQWQPGPRLSMILLINPPANTQFNDTEVGRIESLFANWKLKNSTLYGPYELLGFEFSGAGKKSGLGKGAVAGIVVGAIVVVALILVAFALLFLFKKRMILTPAQKRRAEQRSLKASQHSMLKITGVTAFSYKELAKATDDFSESNEVGRGGYGKVYRGVLQSGQVVAIKRANFEAIQRNTEFYNEIELLSRCHHRNLVALLGYCDDEEEQMLVYEYMQNGSLTDHLSGENKPSLDFASRLKLALGAAKGILYLHTEANPPIFHRDIKSNNILLDDRRHAKVSDFGLSRLAPEIDEASGEPSAHVSTVVKGTPGYLDPEYFLTRKLTDKSDVYSFGVVLLELITGMQPISYGKNLVREVKALYENGELLKVIDTKMGSYPAEIMEPFARLAVACVNNDTDARPTMEEVTRTLETLAKEMQGKGPKDMMRSMDISRDDYSLTKPPAQHERPADVGRGIVSGSSQNSNNQTVSTSHFISMEGNDYLTPR